MKVAVVTGSRGPLMMGLERAEARLLERARAVAPDLELDVRVVGGRAARRHARRTGARWYPALCGTSSRRVWKGADVVHLFGLDVPPPPKRPYVATIHDLAPLRFPDEGALAPWAGELVTGAERLICPSKFTARELEDAFDIPRERIHVVPNGPGWDVATDGDRHRAVAAADLGVELYYLVRLGG